MRSGEWKIDSPTIAMASVVVESLPPPLPKAGSPRGLSHEEAWLRAGRRVLATWPVLLAFTACCVALGVHSWRYWPYLSDDALISLRYSQRLAWGFGLTWTDGERVEGYTNLLWVLLNTPAVWFGVDPIVSARALGFLGVVAAVAALGFSPRVGRMSAVRLVAGGGFLVASASAAVWAIGGLEQGMLMGVAAVALTALARVACWGIDSRGTVVASVALALLVLLRADGALAVAALLGAAFAAGFPNAGRWRGTLRLGLPAAVAVLGQLAFRLVYYGAWWPNSASAKVAFTMDRWTRGVEYVRAAVDAYPVILGLACLGTALAFEHRPRGRVVPAWVLVTLWSLYTAAMGGDVFPAHRSLVMALVALCWLVAEGAEALSLLLGRRVLVAAVSLVPLGAWHVRLQNADPASEHAHLDNWEFTGLAVGGLLKEAFGDRAPLYAVDAAGALPYASELPALDLLGLNDRHIGQKRTAAFGHDAPGHELGDGKYVFERRPDLVAFGCAGGTHTAVFISGHELLAIPEFGQEYQWIRFDTGTPRFAYGEAWVRREGGRIGVVRDAAHVAVPGYLFTGEGSPAIARPAADGVLAAHVPPGTSARLPGVNLEPGRWRVDGDVGGGRANFVYHCADQIMQRVAGGASDVLELAAAQPVEVVANAADPREGPLVIRQVTFVRDPGASPTHRCPSPPPAGSPALPPSPRR